MATHHSRLLNLPTRLPTLVLMQRRTDRSCEPRVIGTNLAFELDIGATEIGLTKADLFLLTRLVVFVEGPHEEAVLTSMFGARLLAAGIRLVPIHGTLNLPALVDSELIDALELPMAIVTDNTNAGRVRRGQPMSPEEAAVVHWTSEMEAKGIPPYALRAITGRRGRGRLAQGRSAWFRSSDGRSTALDGNSRATPHHP